MYQVGNPEILDGNRFLPLDGIPMSKNDCSNIRFADCDPVPFAVAILIQKSLTILLILFSLQRLVPLGHGPLESVGRNRSLNVL